MAGQDILQIAGQFGPIGVFIWYLLAQQRRQDEIAEKRIAADIKMTEAMTLLTAAVENLRRVP
jgi:hypothetical protein